MRNIYSSACATTELLCQNALHINEIINQSINNPPLPRTEINLKSCTQIAFLCVAPDAELLLRRVVASGIVIESIVVRDLNLPGDTVALITDWIY